MAELVDARKQRAVLVMRRAEIAQASMRLVLQARRKRRDHPRLADAGLARDQHNLAVAGLGALPAPQQEIDLLVAADQRGQRGCAPRLEAADACRLAADLPTLHGLGVAADCDRVQLAAFEQIAEQMPGDAL